MRTALLRASIGLTLAACGLDLVGVAPLDDGPNGGLDGGPDRAAPDGSTSAIQDASADTLLDGAEVDAAACQLCVGARVGCDRGACVEARRVFVTSDGSPPNFVGGYVGADTRCQELAERASLGGQWRAWLSNGASSPSTRFTPSAVPYRLLDGTLIATSWQDLVATGTIRAPINRDEHGQEPTGELEVWTGTLPNGTSSAMGCAGFTSDLQSLAPALVGLRTASNSQWTNLYLQECSRTAQRLYCFEQ